jgi:hypothetical protein
MSPNDMSWIRRINNNVREPVVTIRLFKTKAVMNGSVMGIGRMALVLYPNFRVDILEKIKKFTILQVRRMQEFDSWDPH